MTYDPDRTTVMPHVATGYPITDEYPAVPPPRKQKSSAVFLLKLVTGLVVAGVVVIAGVLAFNDACNSRDARQSEVAEQEQSSGDEPAVGVSPVQEPTVDSLPADSAGFWQVTGVPDGLNVRSEPGTQGDIIGALIADQRHVFGTGERATVNGAEWRQVVFGDDDSSGWVSARFLVADTAPDENAPTATPVPPSNGNTSVVCFAGEGPPERSARIEFSNRTDLSGLLRTDDGADIARQSISGTLSNGQAQVTLSDEFTDRVDEETWVFNPTTIVLGDKTTITVANCDSIPIG